MIHAVIVAGHAVLRRFSGVGKDSAWHLFDFQRGEPPLYIGHIQRGVEVAAADPEALLIFSGGQSRAAAGPLSEGFSYWWIAEHKNWFGAPAVRVRAVTEEFARDSFENLLFGICRFREYTGRYPARITLVGWEFKRRRFAMHRDAIGFPARHYRYAGPNNPKDLAQALASEKKARRKYELDPYSSGEEFRRKRDERDPYHRRNGYRLSCPELAGLLRHKGPERYSGPLPWDATSS